MITPYNATNSKYTNLLFPDTGQSLKANPQRHSLLQVLAVLKGFPSWSTGL